MYSGPRILAHVSPPKFAPSQSSPAFIIPFPQSATHDPPWQTSLLAHPQSVSHVEHVSPLLHLPSPHLSQVPQSVGQLLQSSPLLHVPSPQYAEGEQLPQSSEQVEHVSPLLHVPSPQYAEGFVQTFPTHV